MRIALLSSGLIAMAAHGAWAATDDENELLAQLAAAQQDYHDAIETLHDVGLEISSLEDQLDALSRSRDSATTAAQRSSITREIRRIRAELATLQAVFDEAEQDMVEALVTMEAIYVALGQLGKAPGGGSGG